MMISYVCVAMLGFLVFGLGLNVSLNRMKGRRSVGITDDPNDPLHRARVAHSNACEYCPMFAILILLSQGKVATILAILAVVSRYAHAFGILAFTLKKPNPFRYWGSAGTYTSGLLLAVTLLTKHL